MADPALTPRHDKAPMKVGATPVEVRANGARVYEGTAAFGDIVKRYPDLDPPRNEFIPADEAMSPKALASLKGAIFTGGPRVQDWDGTIALPGDHASDLSNPDTAAGLMEGVVLDAWRFDPPDGGYPELKVRVIAHTRPMQQLIESGTCDLSLGMWTAEKIQAGIGPRCGTHYDRIQCGIVYDHLNAVGAARSRTPDGRTARLDADAETRTYPRAGETMKPTPEEIAALAKTLKLDALSPEDAALLAQMTPEAQAMLKKAIEGGAEAGAEKPAETEAKAPTDLAALADMVKTLMAEVTALKAAKTDAKMTPEEEAAAKKKDAAPTSTTSSAPEATSRQDSVMLTDPTAVIAAAQKAGAAAGAQAYNAAAAFVGHVRKDGHAANTTDEAATVMLTTIEAHLPLLATSAKEHIKAQRLDQLRPLYDQAESLRRAALTSQQGEDVGDIIGLGERRDAAGTDTLPMFTAPVRPSRTPLSRS